VLSTLLSLIRKKRKYLEEKPEHLKDILPYRSEKARTEGAITLEKVKKAMYILYFLVLMGAEIICPFTVLTIQ